jgi:hypothetical protein
VEATMTRGEWMKEAQMLWIAEWQDAYMEIKNVFMIPTEFRILEHNVATMSQGAESAMFKKPEKEGKHMKPLFIKGI